MDKCKSAAGIVGSIWSKYKSLAPAFIADPGKAIETMVDFWNKSIAQNGALTIGARQLKPNDEEEGTVVLAGARTFVAAMPVTKPAKLRFTKREGEAAGEVVVCAYSADGKHKELASVPFDGDTPDGKVIEVAIPADQVPVLIVDSKTLTRKIAYSVILRV